MVSGTTLRSSAAIFASYCETREASTSSLSSFPLSYRVSQSCSKLADRMYLRCASRRPRPSTRISRQGWRLKSGV